MIRWRASTLSSRKPRSSKKRSGRGRIRGFAPLGRVEDDAVSPFTLGPIKRLIGPLEEVDAAVFDITHHGDAERDRHRRVASSMRDEKGCAVHRLADAL